MTPAGASGLGVRGALRAWIRQVAAAVYVEIAWGLLAGLATTAIAAGALHAGLCAIAGYVLGRATDAPLWASAPVGVWVVGLDLLFALLAARATGIDASVSWGFVAHLGVVVVAGLLGAVVGHRGASPPPTTTAIE